MAHQPTYLLAPNFRFKPNSGPIALGSLITDPLRPHRALTVIDADSLKAKYPRIETIAEQDYASSRETSHNVSMAVWAQFVQTVSAKISGQRSSTVQTSYTMDSLETMYFVNDPSLEEIEARIKVPRVQAYVKASSFPGLRKPVYMVTGLMVARGFTGQEGIGKRRGAEVEASGSIPTPAGDVGLGANLSKSIDNTQSNTWKVTEDIVFAYQLLKIEIKGWKGTKLKYDELRHKAAYLSRDDESDEDEEGDEEEEEDDDDDDDVSGKVLVNVVTADNLTLSNNADGNAVVELGDRNTKIICISTYDD
ncbi:hypothetical protein TARUN_8913 [Trichoderma arundinaceum]|uniref:Uncharacterized protein n=1 Tax=Trichoderma arundinaceum TaxID=490622 RepID=A0A395NBG1_TRIAR|nr:hypothetical protein TARUN_8913 [Trichoderma arundinaceum]